MKKLMNDLQKAVIGTLSENNSLPLTRHAKADIVTTDTDEMQRTRKVYECVFLQRAEGWCNSAGQS
jgi:hypothetical protein